MAQVVFNEEWVVEARLTDRTGLTKRQIKSSRYGAWIEGVHFKKRTAAGEPVGPNVRRCIIWYNLPLINQLVKDA